MAGRDKDATWHTLGRLCWDLDWSPTRLLYELQNGLQYRTVPPGHVIDWHDRRVPYNFNVEASKVTIFESRGWLTLGVEVLPPTDPEVPAPSVNIPAASPAPPRRVSEAELRKGLQHLAEHHPAGTRPLDAETVHKMMETHFGVSIERDRIRQALKDVAPHFNLPRGRPRKRAQGPAIRHGDHREWTSPGAPVPGAALLLPLPPRFLVVLGVALVVAGALLMPRVLLAIR